MARIRSKDTKPELAVRSMLHKMGFRFRLHQKTLSGCPDIVLRKHHAVVFVHGCFWHCHKNCRNGKIPKTDGQRWQDKLVGNIERDRLVLKELRRAGWNTIVIWECEVRKDLGKVREKLLKQIIGAQREIT